MRFLLLSNRRPFPIIFSLSLSLSFFLSLTLSLSRSLNPSHSLSLRGKLETRLGKHIAAGGSCSRLPLFLTFCTFGDNAAMTGSSCRMHSSTLTLLVQISLCPDHPPRIPPLLPAPAPQIALSRAGPTVWPSKWSHGLAF